MRSTLTGRGGFLHFLGTKMAGPGCSSSTSSSTKPSHELAASSNKCPKRHLVCPSCPQPAQYVFELERPFIPIPTRFAAETNGERVLRAEGGALRGHRGHGALDLALLRRWRAKDTQVRSGGLFLAPEWPENILHHKHLYDMLRSSHEEVIQNETRTPCCEFFIAEHLVAYGSRCLQAN